ncbi:MAG TPA: hypothetical protein VFL17_02495 [Anaerolineae bacterium]|nr:hypothetical protein [Anaerolineae bacterium]
MKTLLQGRVKESEIKHINIGESVVIKPNVQDPDLGLDMGGWQGRITGMDLYHTSVCVHWDSLTLHKMPETLIKEREAKGLGWDEMELDFAEVERTEARDTPRDVAETKTRLERQRELMAIERGELTPSLRKKVERVAEMSALMLRETRSWGIWLLGLGAVHLVASGFLSAPWGILLLTVGLASFYFRGASMFIVYGVTLAWAAINNLLARESGWAIFALFQFFLAFQVFRQFFHFRQAEREYATLRVQEALPSPLIPERAVRAFPWAGCVLGALSLAGLVTSIVMVIVLVAFAQVTELPGFVGLIEGLAVDLGVLGLAVGLASVLSGYPYKVLAWLGIVASALVLLIEIAMSLPVLSEPTSTTVVF